MYGTPYGTPYHTSRKTLYLEKPIDPAMKTFFLWLCTNVSGAIHSFFSIVNKNVVRKCAARSQSAIKIISFDETKDLVRFFQFGVYLVRLMSASWLRRREQSNRFLLSSRTLQLSKKKHNFIKMIHFKIDFPGLYIFFCKKRIIFFFSRSNVHKRAVFWKNNYSISICSSLKLIVARAWNFLVKLLFLTKKHK